MEDCANKSNSRNNVAAKRVAIVDPFIGTEPVDLPPRSGIAATWFWPKPQIGNTHPGACLPFGMVSVMPYSGGYPTGYGCYSKSLQGYPPRLREELQVSGFTHFQQSGVGAIRKYYNYCRVSPFLEEGEAFQWWESPSLSFKKRLLPVSIRVFSNRMESVLKLQRLRVAHSSVHVS